MLNCYYVIFYTHDRFQSGRAAVLAKDEEQAKQFVKNYVNYEIDEEMHITHQPMKQGVVLVVHPDGYEDY